MRIALLGTRGIPASYSGFETCAEQLATRLVERGHTVTVYGRSHHIDYPNEHYRGVRLVNLPTLQNKYLETFVHTFLCSLHALAGPFDVALYFIVGNSPFTWLPRLVRTKTVLNVDGLDWKREKWPLLAKRYIQLSEYLATRLPHSIVTDSQVVQAYYEDRFGAPSDFIAYGSEVARAAPGETLTRFGLEPGQYVLFVGRLEPENRIHHLIEAFRGLETDMRCVIVGDAPYADKYKSELRSLAAGDPRVVFTGYVFGKGYSELGSHAHIFVETSAVGGTHPALIEAMAFGTCVVVNDTPENMEAVGETGFAYDGAIGAASLRAVLQDLLDDPEKVATFGAKAEARARQVYSWESITDEYERLFYRLYGEEYPERLRP